jgi:hypothetical protein
MLIPEPVTDEYQKPPAKPKADRTTAQTTATADADRPDKFSCLGLPKPLPKMTTFIEYASDALESTFFYAPLSALKNSYLAISGSNF